MKTLNDVDDVTSELKSRKGSLSTDKNNQLVMTVRKIGQISNDTIEVTKALYTKKHIYGKASYSYD